MKTKNPWQRGYIPDASAARCAKLGKSWGPPPTPTGWYRNPRADLVQYQWGNPFDFGRHALIIGRWGHKWRLYDVGGVRRMGDGGDLLLTSASIDTLVAFWALEVDNDPGVPQPGDRWAQLAGRINRSAYPLLGDHRLPAGYLELIAQYRAAYPKVAVFHDELVAYDHSGDAQAYGISAHQAMEKRQ